MEDPTKEVARIARIGDPLAQARAAHALLEAVEELSAEVRGIRRNALRQLVDGGMKMAEVGRVLDPPVSRARISQLLSAGTRPERVVLGTGPITIAVGTKTETARPHPSVVISAEALAARDTLHALCAELGLVSIHENIPPPGIVRLNRDGLIVLCSPRLVPVVDEVVEADPHYGFGHTQQGWHLVDRAANAVLRSPMDSGQSTDFGYIGRLPQPGGNGSFLYIAGIHALGTLGAALYLADNLDLIYRTVRDRRWSVLVATRFDPDSRDIVSTETIAPIRRHEGT